MRRRIPVQDGVLVGGPGEGPRVHIEGIVVSFLRFRVPKRPPVSLSKRLVPLLFKHTHTDTHTSTHTYTHVRTRTYTRAHSDTLVGRVRHRHRPRVVS